MHDERHILVSHVGLVTRRGGVLDTRACFIDVAKTAEG